TRPGCRRFPSTSPVSRSGMPCWARCSCTQPVPAGMRIATLRAQAPGQRIDLEGDWLGRGDTARTRLQARVQSNDFGALFSGLGYGGQLDDGEGSLALDATWPGTPAAFA